MKRSAVKSSNIKSVGYDAETKTLEVEFSSGVYAYRGVTPEQHRTLMSAESIGGHFHKHIKSRHKGTKT